VSSDYSEVTAVSGEFSGGAQTPSGAGAEATVGAEYEESNADSQSFIAEIPGNTIYCSYVKV